MKQPDRIFISKWVKKGEKLVFKSKIEQNLFNTLLKGMRDGQEVTFMVDFADDQGRLSQISKLKAGTRELAREVGETFIKMENDIKREAGLYDEISQVYKSFANCSFQELSDAINVLIEKGTFVGIDLK